MRAPWIVLAVAMAGCGASHTAAWQVKSAGGAGGDASADIKAGDEAWAKRDDRAQLEAAIAAWEKATTTNPADCETGTKLARAYYLLADGHLSFEGEAGKDKYLQTHEKGMTAGERALVACSAAFKAKMEAGSKMEQALDTIDAKSAPALYWYTTNLGKWANAQGLSTVLKYKAKIKSQVERIMAVEEHFFYSAAHRYLGVIYAKAPAIAGGDMKQAKVHFEASLANAPNYLATTVLWCEFYAVKSEDKAGFKAKLEWVLKQPDDVIPEITAENKVEKKKAQKLLAMIEEKF